LATVFWVLLFLDNFSYASGREGSICCEKEKVATKSRMAQKSIFLIMTYLNENSISAVPSL
jgi:hypothetical protein